MILSKITITGADNESDPQAIINLSREFPFVEWGILFSKTKINSTKFPIKHYGYILKMLAEEQGININLSAHLAGDWSKEFLDGFFNFQNYFQPLNYDDIFSRVQLNINSTNYPYKLEKMLEIVNAQSFMPFIFPYNKANFKLCNDLLGKGKNIDFLYDSSGGRGISRTDWPSPVNGHFTGYAGGLNPDNLEKQLDLISQKTEENEKIWIDVETGVRSRDDKLDLEKVKKFLTIASKYTHKTEAL